MRQVRHYTNPSKHSFRAEKIRKLTWYHLQTNNLKVTKPQNVNISARRTKSRRTYPSQVGTFAQSSRWEVRTNGTTCAMSQRINPRNGRKNTGGITHMLRYVCTYLTGPETAGKLPLINVCAPST